MIENQRVYLRELTESDIPHLSAILQDEETMYAYEGVYTDQQVEDWLVWNRESYADNGFGLWAIIDKATKAFIGQCGIVYSDVEGQSLLEIGYLVNKEHWGQGYAKEASHLCLCYARDYLKADKICSIIRDTNKPSRKVAEYNGMKVVKAYDKDYSGTPIRHLVYSLTL